MRRTSPERGLSNRPATSLRPPSHRFDRPAVKRLPLEPLQDGGQLIAPHAKLIVDPHDRLVRVEQAGEVDRTGVEHEVGRYPAQGRLQIGHLTGWTACAARSP